MEKRKSFLFKKIDVEKGYVVPNQKFWELWESKSRTPCENWVSSSDPMVNWLAAHRSGSFHYHEGVISVGSVGGGIAVRGWRLAIGKAV